MAITLFNTLSGKKETFKPIVEKHVGMYNCGPTVYDFAHLGNLRSYVFADILRRTLEYGGYEVKQVVNITDIGHLSDDGDSGEDKMTKGLLREGKTLTLESMKELGDMYTERFLEDLDALGIERPSVLPKASEHIPEDIELLKKLDAGGYIYKAADGVYFDTSKFAGYGKLGGVTMNSDEAYARITPTEGKKNRADFAVWKFNDALGYESPWGKGFPGWHIECSAMSMKYLGETFDIHTGGIDHIPVHHNNEIAQSESATGKPYVHYWLHNAFVNVGSDGGGEKMAKSAGNFLRLQSVIDRDFSPLAYRYWLLLAGYRTQVAFSWDALQAAQNAYDRLYSFISELPDGGSVSETYQKQYEEKINDDLDTPSALAVVWQLVKDESVSTADKKATLLDFDRVLGLNLSKKQKEIPEDIQTLVERREEARKAKNFAEADSVRKEIEQNGYSIKDTERGVIVNKKRTP